MKLHQVEPIRAKPAQRTVDRGVDISCLQLAKGRPVRHVLGMHLDTVGVRNRGTKAAQQFLRALINIGAVERCEATVDELGKDTQ